MSKINIKRFSIVFTAVLLTVLAVPAYATNDFNNQVEESATVRSTEYPISNGIVRLVDSGNYIMIQTTKTVDCDNKNRSNSTTHISETEAQVIVPYDSSAHNEIYEEVLDLVESSLNSIENGSHRIDGSDRYHCATFFLSVEFTRETKSDRFTYYDFTNVSGGFSDSSTSGDYVGENVYVTSQYIDVSQNGNTFNDGLVRNQAIFDYAIPTSRRSWSYTPPLNWVAICGDDDVCIMGVAYYFTLSRGAASWSDSISISPVI